MTRSDAWDRGAINRLLCRLLPLDALVLCAEPPTSSVLWFQGVPNAARPMIRKLNPAWFAYDMRQHGFHFLGDADDWVADANVDESEPPSPLAWLGATEQWVNQARRRLRTLDWLAADAARCDALIVGRGQAGLALLAQAQRLLSRHRPLVIFDAGQPRDDVEAALGRMLPPFLQLLRPVEHERAGEADAPRFAVAAPQELAGEVAAAAGDRNPTLKPVTRASSRELPVVIGLDRSPIGSALVWDGLAPCFGVAVECAPGRYEFRLDLDRAAPNGFRIFVNNVPVDHRIETGDTLRLRFAAEMAVPEALAARIVVCPIRQGSVDRFDPIAVLGLGTV